MNTPDLDRRRAQRLLAAVLVGDARSPGASPLADESGKRRGARIVAWEGDRRQVCDGGLAGRESVSWRGV